MTQQPSDSPILVVLEWVSLIKPHTNKKPVDPEDEENKEGEDEENPEDGEDGEKKEEEKEKVEEKPEPYDGKPGPMGNNFGYFKATYKQAGETEEDE